MKDSRPETLEEQLSCEGLRIRFKRAGSGPALVLVHGLLGYSFSWRNAIPILGRNWEVFAPDMPGAGFSECRADLDCRLSSAAHRLLTFLDAAGISSCNLVGSSYGGATAILAAATATERIRKLVLVSPANPWSSIGRKRLALLRNPVISSLFSPVARAAHPLHSYFVKRMWGDAKRMSQETLDGYSLPLRQDGVFEHAVKITRTWTDDMSELQRSLPKLEKVPTLLVWGDKDRVVDPRSAELMKQQLPNARVAVIAGAGHLPYEEAPEEFCDIIEEFLRSQEGRSTIVPHEK